jgi:hypothetical protein
MQNHQQHNHVAIDTHPFHHRETIQYHCDGCILPFAAIALGCLPGNCCPSSRAEAKSGDVPTPLEPSNRSHPASILSPQPTLRHHNPSVIAPHHPGEFAAQKKAAVIVGHHRFLATDSLASLWAQRSVLGCWQRAVAVDIISTSSIPSRLE